MQDHTARTGAQPAEHTASQPIPERQTHDCSPHCPYCGRNAPLVHVHGHAQCGHCGVNREPCCQP